MNNKTKKHKSNEGSSSASRLRKRNKTILEKVKQWQAFPYVRPMICRNEHCSDSKLKPKEAKMRVVLQCPKCKRVQTYVPRIVLTTKLSIPSVLTRNKGRFLPNK